MLTLRLGLYSCSDTGGISDKPFRLLSVGVDLLVPEKHLSEHRPSLHLLQGGNQYGHWNHLMDSHQVPCVG